LIISLIPFQFLFSLSFHFSKYTTSFNSSLGNQFAVSRSGFSANSLTYPKHRYATGMTCSGNARVSFRVSFDRILTHPRPTPSVLADNHKF